MLISDLLSVEDVLNLSATTKRTVLRSMAQHVAGRLAWDADTTFQTLLQREALGSTGIGGGIALPHERFAAIARPLGTFAKLARPVEFGAIDDRPVDLVFLLLLPAGAPDLQMKSLACVARRFKQAGVPEDIRRAADPAAICDLLIGT